MERGYLEDVINLSKDYQSYKNGEVLRYNGKHKLKQESVAEHSFMVAMNIIRVSKLMGISDFIRDKSVTLAIIHDISERFVGDIAYEFKSEEENKSILQGLFFKYEKKLYRKKYEDEMGPIYKELLEKKNVICDRLVKLGDSMSVVQYSTREIELGNSTEEMKRINKDAIDRVKYDYERLLLSRERE